MPMENVRNLHRRGFLTDQQLLIAGRFNANHNAFILPPTLFRILFDLIVRDVPLEKIERTRGWSARSAKVLLSQILFALQELGGLAVPEGSPGEAELASQIRYLRGDDDPNIPAAMIQYGLTNKQACVFAVLREAPGKVYSVDTIIRRVYGRGANADIPDSNTVTVMICEIRKKVARDWVIKCQWGAGYALFPVARAEGL